MQKEFVRGINEGTKEGNARSSGQQLRALSGATKWAQIQARTQLVGAMLVITLGERVVYSGSNTGPGTAGQVAQSLRAEGTVRSDSGTYGMPATQD